MKLTHYKHFDDDFTKEDINGVFSFLTENINSFNKTYSINAENFECYSYDLKWNESAVVKDNKHEIYSYGEEGLKLLINKVLDEDNTITRSLYINNLELVLVDTYSSLENKLLNTDICDSMEINKTSIPVVKSKKDKKKLLSYASLAVSSIDEVEIYKTENSVVRTRCI